MRRPVLLVTLLVGCASEPRPLTVVSANIGTTTGLDHDGDVDDGYTSEEAAIADALYGNGLSWRPAEEAFAAWLQGVRPDVVGLQEGFYDPDCDEIEVDEHLDFICRERDGSLQVRRLVGEGYQVAIAPGQTDNALAVRREVGAFVGCDEDVCALTGFETPGDCGRGARIARGELALVGGEVLTVVLVHGTSGVGSDDEACRVSQVEQVFVDHGDGRPAVGERSLVLGDLNTDPAAFAGADPSADRWSDFVGEGRDFRWHTELDGPPTYAGLVRIDHVASDAFDGGCVHPGVTPGEEAVWDTVYWDHVPVVCALTDK